MELITVAVDGSRVSGNALAWAAGLGRRCGAGVEVVTVLGRHGPVFVDQRDEEPEGPAEWWVEDRQRELVAEVVDDPDDVDLRHTTIEGHPVGRLIEHAAGSDLVVTGTRGVGGFVGLVVGSTAHQLVDHAPCPVAVVPDTDTPPAAPADVVVGVDGLVTGDGPLVWSLAHLAPLVDRLQVVHVATGAGDEVASGELAAAVEQRVGDTTGVDQWVVERGRPTDVLLERAAAADLLVVGAPDDEESRARRIASTAHRCLKRSPVPVLVHR